MRTRGVLLAAHGLVLGVTGGVLLARNFGGINPPIEGSALVGASLALLVFAFRIDRARGDRFLLEPRSRDLWSKLARPLLQAGFVSIALAVLVPLGSTEALAGVLGGGLASVAIVGWARVALLRASGGRILAEGLLVVGVGDTARQFYGELVGEGSSTVAWGVVQGSGEPGLVRPPAGMVIDGRSLCSWAREHGFRRLVVADAPHRMGLERVSALIECKMSGLRVEQAVDSGGRLWSKVLLAGLSPEVLIYADGFRPSALYRVMKRAVDVACAALLLVACAPLLLLLAFAIKAETPGPALYRQERVGQHGRPFTILKFRSMREDAERQTGPTWAAPDDDRVTGVGRVLRKFRLDEIPQVVNVFRGEMSFIGPRPERPYFVRTLESSLPCYPIRHSVKPGITGWAQVMYAYGSSVEDAYQKLQFDLYYVKNMSFALDLRILLGTVRIVLFGRGR